MSDLHKTFNRVLTLHNVEKSANIKYIIADGHFSTRNEHYIFSLYNFSALGRKIFF